MWRLGRTAGYVVIAAVGLVRSGHAQPRAPDCFRGEVHAEPQRIGDFLIRLQSVADEEAPGGTACQVQVFSSQGPVFQASDYAMSIDPVSGKDVNGDGKPD